MNAACRTACLTILSVLCALGGAAAYARHGVDSVRFANYTIADGLSHATARALLQDADGYVWIGTQDGLNRFDGHDFRVYRYDRSNPYSLSDNHITALVQDRNRRIWIGTLSGGLNRFDPETGRFQAYRRDPARADSLLNNSVAALLLDRDGRLWVATSAGRLQWYQPSKDSFFELPLGPPQGFPLVRSLLQAQDGRVWIGTRLGLWVSDANGQQSVEQRYSEDRALDVWDLAEAPDGELVVGSAEQGLFRFAPDGRPRAAHQHIPGAATSLVDNAVRRVMFDSRGRLWIGTMNGLSRGGATLDEFENWRNEPGTPDSLTANRIYAALEDRDGLLWFGSWTNGISIFDPLTEAFVQARYSAGDPRGLPGRPISTLYVDADSTLWLGVLEGGGLVHFDLAQGVLARYTHDPAEPTSLPHNFVQFINRGRDGSLWIATVGGGLARLPPNSQAFERLRYAHDDPGSLGSDNVQHVMEDSRGNLWVSTVDAGVSMRCAGCASFVHFRHDPHNAASLAANGVYKVFESASGDIWVALRPGGLNRIDLASGRIERIAFDPERTDSLSHDLLTAIFEDRQGRLWIGTQGGGINLMLPSSDGKRRFKAYTTKDGLASDAIGAIVEDDQARLWLSTTRGITRFNPISAAVVNYAAKEGAQGAGYFIGSSDQDQAGRIYFGGLNGFTVFDPDAVAELRAPHATVLTDFLLFNRSVLAGDSRGGSPLAASIEYSKELNLDHRQDVLGFAFSALAFANPDTAIYQYRLEGRDQDWIHTDSGKPFATYTNLPSGRYTFRVRAAVAPSGSYGPERNIAIRVAPAPWFSGAAIALYTLATLAILLLSWSRMRARWHERQAAEIAIRNSEQRLKFSLWGSGGELWDADLVSGRIVRDNAMQNLAASAGAGAETLSDYRPFIHADDIAAFDHAYFAHVQGKTEYFEATFRTLGRNGEWLWLLTRGSVVDRDANGRATRMVGINQDITRLKAQEEALRHLNEELEMRVGARTSDLTGANERLRRTLDQLTQTQHQLVEAEKMASLGNLVAGIAHEINTPLGIGVTAASHLDAEAQRVNQLLESQALTRAEFDAFRDVASQSSQIILRNLQRADKLIKSFKQVAVDQSSEQRRVVVLRKYLDEILTSLQPALKKTRHKVTIECPSSLAFETYAGAIYQIVTNLVMNSLIHGFAEMEHGSITIAARVERATIVFEFTDDGQGMREDVRMRVFEPFFTTRRGQGGSGLGMHIVYNLVTQLLRGTIECFSQPGQGARFEIRFPADLRADAQAA